LLHAGQENLFSGLTALTAEFTVGEGELMTHDEPFFMAPDDKHDLISGTCSHLPYPTSATFFQKQEWNFTPFLAYFSLS
ncbi:hypothetical protein, partial [Aeromonas taiwanensis]|uniref:hypothetical protein n=2 Tax=Aeromonas taiwanensis TaxID=633417 RepID=UPI003BA1C538